MKLKTKKIIAKEILYFFICIAVSLLFFGGTFGYNWLRQAQVNSIEKDIALKTLIVDSLNRINIDITNKSKRTFKVEDDFYDIPTNKVKDFIKEYPSATEFKSFIISNDTFNIPINEVQNFLLKNPTAKHIYNFSQIDSISILRSDVSILKSKKCSFQNKILTFDEQARISLVVFVIFLILIYPIRMIFNLIKWALKIVKT